MGSAGFRVRIRSSCDRASSHKAQGRLRRAGFGRSQTARAQEGRPAIQTPERLAVHRQRGYQLRPDDVCTGKAGFGMDAHLDGMVFASVEHPPVLGGKVKSYDEKAPLLVKGVKQTIPIKPFTPPHHFQPLGGVAVIADNTWAAFQGRKKLNVDWDNGANASYNSDPYKKELQETARKPGKVVAQYRRRGRSVCQGRQDHGSRVLCATPGARPHGATRRRGRFPRRQSYASGRPPRTRRPCRTRSPPRSASTRKRDLPRVTYWAAASGANRSLTTRPRPPSCRRNSASRSRWCGAAKTTSSSTTITPSPPCT